MQRTVPLVVLSTGNPRVEISRPGPVPEQNRTRQRVRVFGRVGLRLTRARPVPACSRVLGGREEMRARAEMGAREHEMCAPT